MSVQEPHLEGEVEKCTRRLQQLTQSNEEKRRGKRLKGHLVFEEDVARCFFPFDFERIGAVSVTFLDYCHEILEDACFSVRRM